MPNSPSTRVVVTALAANILVSLSKFAAAFWTGSSAMLSEGVHSLIDSGNEALLLYGERRASLPPDREHPLGYGREIYFWSFVVAILIFGAGAGLSIYDGVSSVLHPEPITNPLVNYLVLAAALLFDGYSWRIAVTSFRRQKGSLGWYEAVRKSKDPLIFIVLFEDSADLIGLGLAFFGTLASTRLGVPQLDGAASIAIGLLLGFVAIILARESKGLLIGEQADPNLVKAISHAAESIPEVSGANEIFTIQLAPRQVLAALNLDFKDDVTAAQIEDSVQRLQHDVKAAYPEVLRLLVIPQSRASWLNAALTKSQPPRGASGRKE